MKPHGLSQNALARAPSVPPRRNHEIAVQMWAKLTARRVRPGGGKGEARTLFASAFAAPGATRLVVLA